MTATIVETERLAQDAANLVAVKRIEQWLDASINAYQTIGVETVLSSPKYQRLVDLAQQRGFEVRMIYVVVAPLQRQLERIRIRVRNGGHDVTADKVAKRRIGSFEQFAWFAEHVDRCFVFDNSLSRSDLVAEKMDGRLAIMGLMPVDLFDTLAAYDLLWLDDTGDLE